MAGFRPDFLGETLIFSFASLRLCVRQSFFQAILIWVAVLGMIVIKFYW